MRESKGIHTERKGYAVTRLNSADLLLLTVSAFTAKLPDVS